MALSKHDIETRKKELEKFLDAYPAKTKKNRRSHIVVRDSSLEEQQIIEANTRTIPGVITNRGCAYAGCKGVVLGPIKDMAHIVHGPIGCSYYAWGTRRNKAKTKDGEVNLINYAFSSDMQESDVVFGGDKKLAAMVDEIVETFKPKAVTISATCPVGLIGDDIGAVAKAAEAKHGIPVMSFSCEGYKGVSQSAGHHIANNVLMQRVIGSGEIEEAEGKYAINILGEYNIGGDSWEIERVLKDIGYHVVSVMTGDGSYETLKNAHTAELNLVQCHRSINYIAEMLEEKYGTPWLKVNFIGVQSTIESLRNMATYFGDPALTQKTEEVIARELAAVESKLEQFKKICDGKTAFCFVGGSRGHHYQGLFKEIGIDTVLAGYEFAHRDDYEGREVIPDIKLDADSKNIEEIKVSKDEKRYKIRILKERLDQIKDKIPLSYYGGMIKDMPDGSIMVDDLNHYETEEFIKILKPDILASGIKDKYVIQKMGIPSKQLHSYDYSGPYAGFRGALKFAEDITMGFTSPTWNYITPPWKQKPILDGTVTEGGK
ncbi:nitrogenase molybdenum-iron protein alpha chain [Desulfuribacillus stibiiarsenatis]|uniref:Nitrogenase protein alpha chain n=1 Tax=Desulfuribacillus stibiiarsenatis TaxID=1390249 RepID=A0A1E5L3C6_9FIRM|nr:nitrogenase molybdenum-iron protein alpha chain [Desulfuribacillus stibiiarsenatis]OEH84638.1 nitrogenase molybdenum-iron protein alpha chain [Desulfuribacillus stibiiarsenatis]